MSCRVWRNFTVRVPVSGTVSVLIVRNSLLVPFATGAVSEGIAALASAWLRNRRAADSGSSSPSPVTVSPGEAARSSCSRSSAGEEDSSKACAEKVVSPFPASFSGDMGCSLVVVRAELLLDQVKRVQRVRRDPQPGQGRHGPLGCVLADVHAPVRREAGSLVRADEEGGVRLVEALHRAEEAQA